VGNLTRAEFEESLFDSRHSPRFSDGFNPHFAVSLAVGSQLVLPLVFSPVRNRKAVLKSKRSSSKYTFYWFSKSHQ